MAPSSLRIRLGCSVHSGLLEGSALQGRTVLRCVGSGCYNVGPRAFRTVRRCAPHCIQTKPLKKYQEQEEET